MRFLGRIVGICVFFIGIASCSGIVPHGRLGDFIDTDIKATREEFRDKLIPPESVANQEGAATKKEIAKEAEPPLPQISQILASPPSPVEGLDKLVSISVTDEVPLKDVLVELGRLADVDMEIDSNITGGINFSVKDKPFNQVISRISDMRGLRYENTDGILRVELDTPYLKTYAVDFINMIRSNTGSISVNTQVLSSSATSGSSGGDSGGGSGGGSTGSGGLTSGSTSALTSSYDGDLWTSIETTLQNIMSFTPRDLSSGGGAGLAGATTGATAQTLSSFSVNKQAGIVSAVATERQQEAIKEYLESVRKAVSAQVLIEAKVVEVSLNDEYRTGINWGNILEGQPNLMIPSGSFTSSVANESVLQIKRLATNDSDLQYAMSLVEKFGTTRTISSPRLLAMNNQQAVLTFAENKVFFRVTLEEQQQEDTGGTTDSTTNITSEVSTVPIGVILTLQPSIDLENQEITMNIRPTLSRVTDEKEDPGVSIIAERLGIDNISSTIPIVEVREMDTVLKIKSGEVMVIGGLMEERNVSSDEGVPFVSRVPVVGNAFKSVAKDTEVVETVVFIKAKIVPGGGVDLPDQNLYKNFARDPRPLHF